MVKLEEIYRPNIQKPMNTVVFGSGTGANLKALIKAQSDLNLFAIRAVFTDQECLCQTIAKDEGLPLIYLPYMGSLSDYRSRIEYDKHILAMLLDLEKVLDGRIDLIVLAGYMKMMTFPLLNHFKDRIINVHPADLTKLDPHGKRLYVGNHTVKKALLNGDDRTRSSVIIIDEHADTGPLLVSGPWISYDLSVPITKKSIKIHQSIQKEQSDIPALLMAIQLISKGKIALDEERNVYLEGKRLPECGFDLTIACCCA